MIFCIGLRKGAHMGKDVEGGKKDVCKAIRDLMDDSREEGREEGVILNKLENAKNLLDVLSDEVIAEKIGLSLEQVKELRLQNQ